MLSGFDMTMSPGANSTNVACRASFRNRRLLTLEKSGNVAEALRVYDRLRVTLREELGIPPSSAVQDVYRRMLGESTTTA